MPAGGLLAASAVGAGGSVLQGILGKSAADKQAAAAKQIAQQAQQVASSAAAGVNAAAPQAISAVNQSVTGANQILSPYTAAGAQGVSSLASMLQPGGALTQQFSFNPTDLQNEPGYQFNLQQGTQAVQNAASSKGLLQSGGTAKALANYSQGLAETSYNDAYNRALTTFQTNRTNTLNGLMDLTQAGAAPTQSAASNTLQGGLYSGNTLTNAAQLAGQFGLQGEQIAAGALTGGANAQAAGTVALGQGIGGALGAAGQGLTLASLLGGGGGGGNSQLQQSLNNTLANSQVSTSMGTPTSYGQVNL